MIDAWLRRAADPTYMGEFECGVCGVLHEVGAVYVEGKAEDWGLDPFCLACIRHLGKRDPNRFPTLEQFEEAKKRYPEPIYDYEPEDALWLEACEVSYIDHETLEMGA